MYSTKQARHFHVTEVLLAQFQRLPCLPLTASSSVTSCKQLPKKRKGTSQSNDSPNRCGSRLSTLLWCILGTYIRGRSSFVHTGAEGQFSYYILCSYSLSRERAREILLRINTKLALCKWAGQYASSVSVQVPFLLTQQHDQVDLQLNSIVAFLSLFFDILAIRRTDNGVTRPLVSIYQDRVNEGLLYYIQAQNASAHSGSTPVAFPL